MFLLLRENDAASNIHTGELQSLEFVLASRSERSAGDHNVSRTY